MGIEIHTTADFPPDIFGALAKHGNGFEIFVSTQCETDGHRRFTISHELGHYFIEGHVDELLGAKVVAPSIGGNYRKQKDPIEVEADAFASELLMPQPLASKFTRHLPVSITSVRALADRFVVSLSAAAVRFTMLSDAPCVAILSREGAIEWLSPSASLQGHGWISRSLRGEWIPRGSGTSRLYRDKERVAAGKQDSDVSSLSVWFDGAPDVEATDECIGLGRYGRVLTLVSCPDLPSPEDVSDDEEPGDWRDALRTYRLGP